MSTDHVGAAPAADRVRALLAKAPIFDGHNDLPWALRVLGAHGPAADGTVVDLERDCGALGLQTDLPRLRAGGVGAQYWSVYVSHELGDDAAVTAVLEQMDAVTRMVARYPDWLGLAGGADEVQALRERGRIAGLMGVEGGHCIGESLGVLRMLHALGARYLTLTHNRNTRWADSATDTPVVGGLSKFGREVVRECNRLGVLVDLSHVAATTMRDAIATSTAPAFFSHSNARALCDHPRNVPDDVLALVRDTNGMVMATFVPGFLTEAAREWLMRAVERITELARSYPEGHPERRATMKAWMDKHPCPPSGVSDVANHIEHIRSVAGVAHVGLGGDFDGTGAMPDGLGGVDGYPNLLAELARRGWSDAELAALTWGNAIRVLRDTEAAARAAQHERGPSLATITALDGAPPAG